MLLATTFSRSGLNLCLKSGLIYSKWIVPLLSSINTDGTGSSNAVSIPPVVFGSIFQYASGALYAIPNCLDNERSASESNL